jgi:hypothetical protein
VRGGVWSSDADLLLAWSTSAVQVGEVKRRIIRSLGKYLYPRPSTFSAYFYTTPILPWEDFIEYLVFREQLGSLNTKGFKNH